MYVVRYDKGYTTEAREKIRDRFSSGLWRMDFEEIGSGRSL